LGLAPFEVVAAIILGNFSMWNESKSTKEEAAKATVMDIPRRLRMNPENYSS